MGDELYIQATRKGRKRSIVTARIENDAIKYKSLMEIGKQTDTPGRRRGRRLGGYDK